MLSNLSNNLSVIFGATGAGIGSWISLNHEVLVISVVTAFIFALVGGIVGHCVNKMMYWVSKKLSKKRTK